MISLFQQSSGSQQFSLRRAFFAGGCFLIAAGCLSAVQSQRQTASVQTGVAHSSNDSADSAAVRKHKSALPPEPSLTPLSLSPPGKPTRQPVSDCTLSNEERREIAAALEIVQTSKLVQQSGSVQRSKLDKPNLWLPRQILEKLIERVESG